MTERQPSLFEMGTPDMRPTYTPPYAPDSPTSRDAAEAIKPRATSLREQVFRVIQAAGENGLTDEEGQDLLALGGSTFRPRRGELVEAGRVKDSGKRRPVRSGNAAVVWVAVKQ